MDLENALLVAFAFALGGILKGATGAGAPVVSVPVLAVLYDVRFAVAMIVMPNIIPNLWQAWTYRHDMLQRRFVWSYAIAGGIGAGIGTVALASLKGEVLSIGVACVVLAYVAFRLLKASWVLGFDRASRVVWPVGILGGILQGASGLSAPVSITFLNAMKLERGQFISCISMFFAALGFVQLPLQAHFGIMTPERLLFSLLALIPLMGAMPLGAWIGRHMSRETFDRIMLGLLFLLAIKLLTENLF